MKIKATKLFIIILFFIGNSEMFSQNDSFTLLGRWAEGYTNAVAVKDDIAFIGNGSNLTLVDISEAETPVEVSSYLLTNIVSAIALSDRYAYVIGNSLQLHIIDFSDPNNLVEVGSVGISSYNSKKIFFSNNYVYIVLPLLGFEIIDVSDPTAPVKMGMVNNSSIADIFVQGNYAFVPSNQSGMLIYDVSDPANPTVESAIEDDYTIYSVIVVNNYAYLGESVNLRIFDVSDKANPIELSSVECVPQFLVFENGFVYATEQYGSLAVVNVSDPNNPAVVATLPYGSFKSVADVAVRGNDLLISEINDGLLIVDVSDHSNIVEKSLFQTGSQITDVIVKDNLAFVSDYANGMYILSLENKMAIDCIAKVIPESNYNTYRCLTIQDNYVYLGSEYGLYIIDISDPYNPVIVKEVATQRIDRIVVEGNYAYIAQNGGRFYILDISDPLNPVETGTLDEDIYRFAIQNDNAVVVFTADITKLSVLDISDAYNPEVISEVGFENLSVLRDITIYGSYVYAVGGHNLNIVDISDNGNPSIAGTYSGDGSEDWRSISVSGEDAYVCNMENLTTINVAEPANPLEAGKYSTPDTPAGFPANLFVDGTTVYFAQSEIGLLVLENNYPTDVDEETFPVNYVLKQNYPNPFGEGTQMGTSTTITYSIPSIIANKKKSAFSKEGQTRNDGSYVTLKVYDILGREVATLINREQTPGNYSIQFNAAGLSSGIYFYKLDAGSFRSVKKMILLK